MQFNFHGIGTILYGQRDSWPDGSFITTEWAILGWIPLFPISSKRISYMKNWDYAIYDASGYWVYDTLPPDPVQVRSVYAWFAAFITDLVLGLTYNETISTRFGDGGTWAWLISLGLIAAVPYSLRKLERRRKAKEWERAKYGLGPVRD